MPTSFHVQLAKVRGHGRAVLLSLALVLVLVLAPGCHKHAPSQPSSAVSPPAIALEVATISESPEALVEEYVGTVQSRLRAGLEARTTARIIQYLAVPGTQVKQGQLLVELDSRDLQAHVDQATAIRDLATKESQRLRALIGQKAIAQADLDTAESRLHVSEASLKEAETMLSHVRIVAPFEGVITRKLADTGDLATPGRVVVEMENPKSLRVEVDFPESLLTKTQGGQSFPVRWDRGGTNQTVHASVSEMEPSTYPSSRTFRVRLDLPEDAPLRTGQFVRVLVAHEKRPVLRIPQTALIRRGQLETVFVVQDHVARLRLVRVAETFTNDLTVLSGLTAGERIVTSPPSSLTDGQPVQEQP